MKQLLLILTLTSLTSIAMAQIADVQQKGTWIIVYDASGKQLSTMNAGGKEVSGFGNDFFVVTTGNWITTYDANCREIASLNASNGLTVRGASGGSFTVKNGNWIVTYDKHCKEISSRSGN